MKQVIVATIALISLTLAGCAHGVMRGSVAMKTSKNEAHVCLGKGDVKVGDSVRLYTNRCSAAAREGADVCEMKFLGNGKVTKILNEHYSVVAFDEGVKFEEGTFVERL